MTADKLIKLLHNAYTCGLQNGTQNSNVNFNDFINTPELKLELKKLPFSINNELCKHGKGSVIFKEDKVFILCQDCGKLY